MSVPALIDEAMLALGTDQAGLARRIGVGESAVSKWYSGKSVPDFVSCLRLARETGLPAQRVLVVAGHDPRLLPMEISRELTPMQRDVMLRMERIQAAVDATEGLPDDFVDVYLRKVLDNTEDEITATIQMVRQLRRAQGGRIELSVEAAPDLTDAIGAENSDSTGLGDELNGCKVLPRRVLLVSR